ncbi:hypothetical protein ElyMa_006521100 [Elysia marginata]|uniref:Uncharacterized protein n=1 Tax=Elysia marginata TaxID=1093978 RepID=A0AAV4I937_9GAST|nr:hypothetical protein ElyMa_006521100 [Elysia marginata]
MSILYRYERSVELEGGHYTTTASTRCNSITRECHGGEAKTIVNFDKAYGKDYDGACGGGGGDDDDDDDGDDDDDEDDDGDEDREWTMVKSLNMGQFSDLTFTLSGGRR